jgi:hypothetical protein
MSRRSTFLLLALGGLLAFAQAARAGTIGDPTVTSGQGRVSLAGEVDFGERDIEFDRGGDADLGVTRFLGTAAYGFGPAVDGFLKLGAATGEIDPGGTDIERGLAIGFGARGAFHDDGEIRLGALGQLVFYQSELDTAAGQDIDWYELDIATAASFRGFGQLVPYAGLKVSLVDGDVEGGGDFEQDGVLGFFGGATFVVTRQLSLGGEVRLANETALAVSLRLLF